MINTAKQLKDLIRNLSKKNSADAQVLLRNYMMERFLERLSLSEYRDKFILKGGMLVAAMVGLDIRSTMDLDATIKGMDVSIEAIERIVTDIVSVHINDGVVFHIKQVSEIMDEAEYPGVRISVKTEFDGVKIPLKIDVSCGDAITPQEIRYSFKLMLEDRTINVWAYNLETVLAEKMETIISRNITNTRMRDFYDIYILHKTYRDTLDYEIFREALHATADKRRTDHYLKNAEGMFDEILNDQNMKKLWSSYQKKFSYATDISWETVMESVKELYAIHKNNETKKGEL